MNEMKEIKLPKKLCHLLEAEAVTERALTQVANSFCSPNLWWHRSVGSLKRAYQTYSSLIYLTGEFSQAFFPPPSALIRNSVSTGSCCLAQQGWAIPAQSSRNVQGCTEELQGTSQCCSQHTQGL